MPGSEYGAGRPGWEWGARHPLRDGRGGRRTVAAWDPRQAPSRGQGSCAAGPSPPRSWVASSLRPSRGAGPAGWGASGAGPAGSGAGVAHAQREGAEGGDGGVPIPRGWTLPCRMACGSGDEARGISGEEWWGWARGGHGGWVGVVPVPRCPVGNVGPVACGVEMVQPGSILAPQTAQCSLIPLPCLRSPLPRTV